MENRKNLNLELYKKLYLIRRAEEKIIEHYHEDEMKTPMHMSMGGEAISVGICQALKNGDQVFGTYRSHALYLSKTGDTDDFFAEIYGKATALLKGKGGSMHLCAPGHGFMGASAIVASVIPVAIGAAFANKRAENGKIVAVFFGDGAIDEGVFWESLNFAALMSLPILFICEDNGYAVHNPAPSRHGYDSIAKIVEQFRCKVFVSDSTDTEEIYQLTAKAIGHIKTVGQPCFLHLKYYRYLEHVGVREDFDAGYRSRAEFEKWRKRDPILLQRNKLKQQGCSEEELIKIEESINQKIDMSLKKAKEASFIDKSVLYDEVT